MGNKGRKGVKGKPPRRPVVDNNNDDVGLSAASLQLRDEIDQDGQTMRRYIIENIDYGGNQTLDEHAMELTVRRKGVTCYHGAEPSRFPPPVKDFVIELQKSIRTVITTIEQDEKQNNMNFALSMNQMMRLVPRNIHPNYNDKVACDSVVACLVSLGTNYICVEDCQNQLAIMGGWTGTVRKYSIGLAGFVAMAILLIDNGMDVGHYTHDLNDEKQKWYCTDYLPKVRDLWQDREKEVVKFFHKRNGCVCLKKKYDELRTHTSMGNCHYCRESFERKKLMLCIQCKNSQYCSKVCQRAHWPKHRIFCEGTEFCSDVRGNDTTHPLPAVEADSTNCVIS
jgi:hypothetical protein